MLTFLIVVVAFHLLYLLFVFFVYLDLPRFPAGDEIPDGGGAPLPLVSICIPARDEEAVIADCVRSACQQSYPRFEVLVIDDRSRDRTLEKLHALRDQFANLTVIEGVEPPADWMGKPHALWQLQSHAKGDYLLFIDADTRMRPRCLTAVMARVIRESHPFITIIPHIELKSFWEYLAQGAVIKCILGLVPARQLADPAHKAALANGPFMLFERSVYDAIGGHAAVRNEVVEDLALGQLLKRHGYPIIYGLGVDLQSLRMYTDLTGIWRGWSKNFFLGMQKSVGQAVFITVLLAGMFVLPYLLLPVLLMQMFLLKLPIGATMAIILAFLTLRYVHHLVMAAFFHLETKLWFLEPIGFAVMIGIVWNSARIVLSKAPLQWRGRNIHLD